MLFTNVYDDKEWIGISMPQKCLLIYVCLNIPLHKNMQVYLFM